MELLIAIAVIWFLLKLFTDDFGNTPAKPPPAARPASSGSPPLSPSPQTRTTPPVIRPPVVTPPPPSSSYTPRPSPSDSAVYTYVAGAPHRIGKATPVGTVFYAGQTLRAERERSNRHDSNAIKLKIGQRHVGYVPKEVNEPLACHMDYGGSLSVRVTRVNADDRWLGVRIAVTAD